MFPQRDLIANRPRVLGAIILVAFAGLMFTFAVVSQLAAIKTAKNEKTSAKTVIASEPERKAALARLFTNETGEIGKAGNYAGPNLMVPVPQGTPTQAAH